MLELGLLKQIQDPNPNWFSNLKIETKKIRSQCLVHTLDVTMFGTHFRCLNDFK